MSLFPRRLKTRRFLPLLAASVVMLLQILACNFGSSIPNEEATLVAPLPDGTTIHLLV